MFKLIASFVLAVICSVSFAGDHKPFPSSTYTGPVLAWEASPDFVMDIKWHRTTGLPFVEEGVCHLVMPDDAVSLRDGEDQMRFCAAHGAQKAVGSSNVEGATRVHMWFKANTMEVQRYLADMYGGKPDPFRRIGGFYSIRGNHCDIVVSEEGSSAGHEWKHCADGDFHFGTQHDERGAVWKPVPK